MVRTLIILFFISYGFLAQSQYIPALMDDHLGLFLNELRNDKIIFKYNQSAFPYSENQVHDLLKSAEYNSRMMNERQKKELGFYLRQFNVSSGENNKWHEHDVDIFRSGNDYSFSLNPPGFFYQSNNTSFQITPASGALFTLTDIDQSLKRHYGIRLSGNISSFGYYFGYKRNYNSVFTYENYVQNMIPAHGFTYHTTHDFKFGISFSNQFLTAALLYDNQAPLQQTGYFSSFQGELPSYPNAMLSFTPVEWIMYQFRTGRISETPDNTSLTGSLSSSGFYTSFALNQIIVNPFRQVEITLGQASFQRSTSYKTTYALPLNIYVSNNASDNTFLFYRVNISAIKHLSLSWSHTIDDFSFERMQSEYDKNVHAYTAEASLTNWPIPNTALQAFYALQTPLLFEHTQTPLYNLWPSLNNSPIGNRRLYGFKLSIKPTFNLLVNASWQNETVGALPGLSDTYPYGFSVLNPAERTTDIISFEFIVKAAYNTSFIAGIHFIEHSGRNPEFRVADYNKDVTNFFRLGFVIGL